MMHYLDDALQRMPAAGGSMSTVPESGRFGSNESNGSHSDWSESARTCGTILADMPIAPRQALAPPQQLDLPAHLAPSQASAPLAVEAASQRPESRHAGANGAPDERPSTPARRPGKLRLPSRLPQDAATPPRTPPSGAHHQYASSIGHPTAGDGSSPPPLAAVGAATGATAGAAAGTTALEGADMSRAPGGLIHTISSSFGGRLQQSLPDWRARGDLQERDLGPMTPSSIATTALSQDLRGFNSVQSTVRSSASSRISFAGTVESNSSPVNLSVRLAEVDEMSEDEVRRFAKELQIRMASSPPKPRSRRPSSRHRGASAGGALSTGPRKDVIENGGGGGFELGAPSASAGLATLGGGIAPGLNLTPGRTPTLHAIAADVKPMAIVKPMAGGLACTPRPAQSMAQAQSELVIGPPPTPPGIGLSSLGQLFTIKENEEAEEEDETWE